MQLALSTVLTSRSCLAGRYWSRKVCTMIGDDRGSERDRSERTHPAPESSPEMCYRVTCMHARSAPTVRTTLGYIPHDASMPWTDRAPSQGCSERGRARLRRRRHCYVSMPRCLSTPHSNVIDQFFGLEVGLAVVPSIERGPGQPGEL